MPKEKAVLAYSGGLDTSVILDWLIKEKNFEVIAFMADLGQEENFKAAEKKARDIGASDVIIKDLKREFVTGYIFPAIRANAMYEGRYLLGTSLARPLTAKTQVDIAKEVGATIVSHGATGKGNDQVRFEFAYLTLMPEAKIYAPWKDPKFLENFKGRDDMIKYAQANKIPIAQSTKDPWSSDDNIMHISYEAGMLEDPAAVPFERMFKLTVSPIDAPDYETLVEIRFGKGNPIKVRKIESYNLDSENGLFKKIKYGEEYTGPLDLFVYLNKVAGANGIGRVDMVEDRFVGMKSRGVYETPAGTVLHFAHKDLEGITLDREIIRRSQHTSIDLAERIYSGFWFSPERIAMQRDIDSTQQDVNGTVRLGLYKGNIIPRGRFSENSLYDEGIASMHEEGGYDQTKARGFIDIVALRLQVNARRDIK